MAILNILISFFEKNYIHGKSDTASISDQGALHSEDADDAKTNVNTLEHVAAQALL